jgi:hypothetical protein
MKLVRGHLGQLQGEAKSLAVDFETDISAIRAEAVAENRGSAIFQRVAQQFFGGKKQVISFCHDYLAPSSRFVRIRSRTLDCLNVIGCHLAFTAALPQAVEIFLCFSNNVAALKGLASIIFGESFRCEQFVRRITLAPVAGLPVPALLVLLEAQVPLSALCIFDHDSSPSV